MWARTRLLGRSRSDDLFRRPVIRAGIFDLDGLLVDSEVYWERARAEYCRSIGHDWTREEELLTKGLNSREWAQVIRERAHASLPLETIIEGVTDQMEKLYAQHLPLLPGAISAVRDLAERYPLGLASSSPPELIDDVLTQAGIRQCISVVVSSDEVGKGKPSPDVFLEAARRLDVLPPDVVVLEDSSSGMLAAHRAGMRLIAVPNSHFPPTEEALQLADVVLTSLLDLDPDLLESLNAAPRKLTPEQS